MSEVAMAKRKSERANARMSEFADERISESVEEREVELEQDGGCPAAECEPEEAIEVVSGPEPEAKAEEDVPYTMGEWNGKPQWKCTQCPWDTLEGEAAVLAHIAAKHRPPAPQASVLVADKYGNPK